jgi:hypothetical protein
MLLMVCSILGEGRNLFRISCWRQCFHSPLDFSDQPAVNARMHGTRTFAIVAALSFLFPTWLQASSRIPISYIPKRTMAAIRSYVPGAEIIKAEIGSDDTWGRTYKCDYFRGRQV